jgi:hypothetical protein
VRFTRARLLSAFRSFRPDSHASEIAATWDLTASVVNLVGVVSHGRFDDEALSED